MTHFNRRKPYAYKVRKVIPPKTTRVEMTPVQRAFAVSAILGGSTSHNSIAKLMGRDQSGISKLVKRTTERAAASGADLWDSILYENDLGRGRSKLLSQEQKDEIVRITVQDRAHREQEPQEAIAAGNFNGIGVEISCTTFENVIYAAGYSRRAPGEKPPLTEEQQEARF